MKRVRKIIREILMEADLMGMQSDSEREAALSKDQEDMEQQVADLEDLSGFMKDLEQGQDSKIKGKVYNISHPDAVGPDKKVQNKFRTLQVAEKDQEEEYKEKYADAVSTFDNSIKTQQEKITNMQKTGAKEKMTQSSQETGDVVSTPDTPNTP